MIKTFRNTALISMLAILAACSADSLTNTVPAADESADRPENISWLARASLQSFLDFNVMMGWRSGFIVSIARDGQVIHSLRSGYADIASERPFTPDTRVRIASMTKPVTAVAAMILVEHGQLHLDDPVAKYIPAAANASVALSEKRNHKNQFATEKLLNPITVRHLLTFTSGIGWDEESDLGDLWQEWGLAGKNKGDLQQRVDRMFSNAPLFEQPGTEWRYGGSADVLGRVIEVASGQTFAEFLQQRVFAPLGMSDTSFAKEAGDISDLATMYTQNEAGDLIKTQAVSHSTEWSSGGGGLISTSNDYMRFALMLFNQGSYQGVQLLKPETLTQMTSVHVSEGVLKDMGVDGMAWGLGMSVVHDPEATPMTDRKGDFWWAGFYDTKFFVSPSSGLTVVVMAQNQPSEFSPLPVATHAAQSFIYWGL